MVELLGQHGGGVARVGLMTKKALQRHSQKSNLFVKFCILFRA